MKFNKQILKAVIQHQTNKLAEQLMPSKEGDKLTSEEQGIRDVYLSFHGCAQSESRASYKRKTEKRFKEEGRTLNPKTFAGDDDDDGRYSQVILAAFVPIANPNSHNYTLNRPAVFYGTKNSNEVLGVDKGSNYMSTNKSSIRIAEEDEIDEIVEVLGTMLLRRTDLDEKEVFFVEIATEKDIQDAIAIVDEL